MKEFGLVIDGQKWMLLMHFDVWGFRYLVLELIIANVMDGYTHISLCVFDAVSLYCRMSNAWNSLQ